MAKHTPGPWSTDKNDWGAIRSAEGQMVADICPLGGLPVAKANSRLIAAAPDLLEALLAVAPRGWLKDDTMDHMPGIKAARAAIAKVRRG